MGPVHNPLFTPPDRRFKVTNVTPELLFFGLFSPLKVDGKIHYVEVFDPEGNPLPKDLTIEAILYDPMDRVFRVRFWSSTFPEIEATQQCDSWNLQIHSRILGDES